MNLISVSIRDSLRIMKEDKWIIFFSLFPVLIGVGLFSLFGHWLFTDVVDWAKGYIDGSISSETWGAFLYYVLIVFLSVAVYVVVSFSFVLIISLIASPFNDIISSRVASAYKGKEPESVQQSLMNMAKHFWGILLNEIKKVGFILFLTLIAVVFSFVPFLAPFGVILSAMLIAINFLDYSWSRNNYTFGECIKFLKSSVFVTIISGVVTMFFMSIPVINLFALPFSVIFFTIIFVKKEKTED